MYTVCVLLGSFIFINKVILFLPGINYSGLLVRDCLQGMHSCM